MLMYQLLKLGKWRISSACPELIRAIPLMQVSPKNSADIDDSPLDHAPDSARYGLKTYLRTAKVPHDERVKRYIEAKGVELPAEVPSMVGQVLDKNGNQVDWNRIAMLSRMAEATMGPRRMRAKAKGYGRPQV